MVNTLVKHSVYFQLSYQAQLVFVGLSFLIFMGMYLVWLVRFACRKTIEKFRSNSEKAGQYIDNAFDDTEEK